MGSIYNLFDYRRNLLEFAKTMKIKNLLLPLLMALAFIPEMSYACTSAVITGKATPDGRPLLWKNRDTDCLPNHIGHFRGEKYDFIANVNSDRPDSIFEAWIGMNSAGFALMNTQSYNLVEIKDGEERGAANGAVIFRALGLCRTVDDFKTFLDTIAKPSLIEANFGVIDAEGGAAFFETGYYGYTMYDANDPEVAPEGYIARTNFSVSGSYGKGSGYVRYVEADSVLKIASREHAVTPEFIYNALSRSFHNPVIGVDLRDGSFNKPGGSGWFVDEDFIPRNITSCSIVIQGVKEGESPALETMWTLFGYPPASVAVPLWIPVDGETLPEMVSYDPKLHASPLSYESLRKADEVFGYNQGNGTRKYLNWEKLYNASGDGYMQQSVSVEAEIFELTRPVMEEWYAVGKIDSSQKSALYSRIKGLVE